MGPEYTVPMRRLLLCVLAAVFAGACHGGGGGGAISSPTPSYSPSPTPTVPAGCVQVEGVSSAVVVATATSADEFALDLPFMLFYRLDAEGKEARLAANTGLQSGMPASAQCIDMVPLDVSTAAAPTGSPVRTRRTSAGGFAARSAASTSSLG